MKRKLLMAVCLCGLLVLPGCIGPKPGENEPEQLSEPENSAEGERTAGKSQAEKNAMKSEETADGEEETLEETQISLFKEMPEEYVLSSGAGGWSTELKLNDDGTFTGFYHDSDLGDMGENYPNGTIYVCNFSGSFSEPVQTDAYTWVVKMDALQTEETGGREYYEDGIRYICAEPYGLTGTDEMKIFVEGAPVAQLPEGFLSWGWLYFDSETEDRLPCYGIYNEESECAFFSME